MNDPSKPEAKRPYVGGIDGIRFIAALWVAFAHGLHPPIKELQIGDALLGKVITSINSALYNGVAAVVVFFIISGFCIHYPNVGKTKIDVKRFILRRMIRILVPFLTIVLISHFAGGIYTDRENGVLWSVYCEIVYYMVYPFCVNMRINFIKIIVFSSAMSAVLLMFHLHYIYLHDFGMLTWLYCAPAWLAGTQLAQRFATVQPSLPVWLWRISAIAVSAVMTVATKLGVPYTVSAIPVLIFGYFWLKFEFQVYKMSRIRSLIDKLGLASYSIYLVHPLSITVMGPYLSLNPNYVFLHWLKMISIFTISVLIFYFGVERPAHILARKF